ncbi:hypothetical protein [Loktanella sp. SALINAS62]|uniref:hypothetical protein n=1 Tax=Loktanella sp. SALINAS62 TaxID=2706124 RepID=UPI001B8BC995|nr:hypothetical protein [Loktanella sp. SALINAS62]MBS1302313.1 hypothetical protein [Loktanella sp. SALINAS62]
MPKIFLAIAAALTLALPQAAHAELDQDKTLARVAVGVVAALVLTQLLSSDDDDTATERGGLRDSNEPPVVTQKGAVIGDDWQGTALPSVCARGAEHYDSACLQDRLPVTAPLPKLCEQRGIYQNRVIDLYHAGCLRAAGYR